MENYKIAVDKGGRIGHAVTNIQTQINLGLKKGYDGFDQEKGEVLSFLTDLYKKAIENGRNFVPFVVTESVITYAFPGDNGPVACHEPALLLTADKSPLYGDESEEEWKELVEEYACLLAYRFEQFRVYVTYTRVETKVFQRA